MQAQKCFKSICRQCGNIVPTQQDQSKNPYFVCGKDCEKAKKQKNINHLIDTKYGLKCIRPLSYMSYMSYLTPLQYLFPSLFQNDVRCDYCHRRFLSDDCPDFCKDCVDTKIEIESECIICSTTYHDTPHNINKNNDMCRSCINSEVISYTCEQCKEKYTDTRQSFIDLHAAICETCRVSDLIRKKYLHSYCDNQTINTILAINKENKKYIRVYYDVTSESHDGYCSDHDYDDVKIEIYPEYTDLPLIGEFNIADLSLNKRFKYFYTPDPQPNCGNGCSTISYDIDYFEIIN